MVNNKFFSKKIDDSVFSFSKKAKEQQIKLGKENVINGTLGVFYNEDEELFTLNTVYNEFKNLTPVDIFGYASTIDGDENFKEAVKISVLGKDYKKMLTDKYADVVATTGGTGAIYNTFRNYSYSGEKILLPNYMWGSYKVIAKECLAETDTYKLFNNEGNFDLKDFTSKVLELSKIQKSLIVVINDPCHNPTGYKLSKDEWNEVVDILKLATKNCDIILLKDIAYSDFDEESLNMNEIFEDLPKNFLVVFAFSISKAFGSYGLRVGAQLGLSSSKEVIEEFLDAGIHTSRGTWSNISRSGMTMVSNLVLNSDKYTNFLKERDEMTLLLKERGEIFVSVAKEIDLDVLPYKSGFFLFVPCKNSDQVIKSLEKENMYTTGGPLGIRVALCSIPKNKLEKFAKKLKEYIEI